MTALGRFRSVVGSPEQLVLRRVIVGVDEAGQVHADRVWSNDSAGTRVEAKSLIDQVADARRRGKKTHA